MNKSVTFAECSACAAQGKITSSASLGANGVPVNNGTGWITLFGPLSGTVFSVPSTQMPSTPGQPARPVSIQPTHFCPACATALGVDKIQAAVTPAKPAAK